MAIPMNLFRSSNATTQIEKPDIGNTRTFRVLMKKGNKQTTCELEVPTESKFIANRERDSEWEKEQREVKQKVLEYEQQEAEEELLNSELIPYDIGKTRDPSKMAPKNKKLFYTNSLNQRSSS